MAARCARGAIGAKFGGLLEVEGDLADREGFFLGSSRQEEESEGKRGAGLDELEGRLGWRENRGSTVWER